MVYYRPSTRKTFFVALAGMLVYFRPCRGELSSKENDMNFETFFFLVLSWFFLTVLGIDLNSFGI